MKECEDCEYRDSPDHCKPCLECKEHEEWQPRIDMHLKAYGG